MTSEYEKRICSLTSDFLDECIMEMENEYHTTISMVSFLKDRAEGCFPTFMKINDLVKEAHEAGLKVVRFPGYKFTSDFPIPFGNATDDFDWFIKVIQNDRFKLDNAYEAYVNLAVGFLMGKGTTDMQNPDFGYINQAFFTENMDKTFDHPVDTIINEARHFELYLNRYCDGFNGLIRRMREMDDFIFDHKDVSKWPRSVHFNFEGVTKVFNFIKWACQLNVKIFHSFSAAFIERMLQYKTIFDNIYLYLTDKGILTQPIEITPETPLPVKYESIDDVVADTQPNPMKIDIEKLLKEIQVGKLYQHFKGREYRVLSLGKHSETGEYMVTYKALYGDKAIWVRPLTMWFEEVKPGIRRFRLVEDEDEPKKKE